MNIYVSKFWINRHASDINICSTFVVPTYRIFLIEYLLIFIIDIFVATLNKNLKYLKLSQFIKFNEFISVSKFEYCVRGCNIFLRLRKFLFTSISCYFRGWILQKSTNFISLTSYHTNGPHEKFIKYFNEKIVKLYFVII